MAKIDFALHIFSWETERRESKARDCQPHGNVARKHPLMTTASRVESRNRCRHPSPAERDECNSCGDATSAYRRNDLHGADWLILKGVMSWIFALIGTSRVFGIGVASASFAELAEKKSAALGVI